MESTASAHKGQPSVVEESGAGAASARRRYAILTLGTALLTYALIVFGGVVRITGSGMGCGDDWPLCNGQLIPPMDFETLIEYGHRLVAALVSFLVLGVALYAVKHRRTPGVGDRGLVGWSMLALFLLIAQVLVGAVTVWLELPTETVVLHLIVASLLLAALIIAGIKPLAPAATDPSVTSAPRSVQSWVWAATLLGFVTLVFGGLVANTGAAVMCRGFPLCNGQLFPDGGAMVQLHWIHRLLAYALLIVVAVAALRSLRYGATGLRRAATASLVLVAAQIGVAAAMVLLFLPDTYRALHLAVGAALWVALVVWAVMVRLGGAVGARAVPVS